MKRPHTTKSPRSKRNGCTCLCIDSECRDFLNQTPLRYTWELWLILQRCSCFFSVYDSDAPLFHQDWHCQHCTRGWLRCGWKCYTREDQGVRSNRSQVPQVQWEHLVPKKCLQSQGHMALIFHWQEAEVAWSCASSPGDPSCESDVKVLSIYPRHRRCQCPSSKSRDAGIKAFFWLSPGKCDSWCMRIVRRSTFTCLTSPFRTVDLHSSIWKLWMAGCTALSFGFLFFLTCWDNDLCSFLKCLCNACPMLMPRGWRGGCGRLSFCEPVMS